MTVRINASATASLELLQKFLVIVSVRWPAARMITAALFEVDIK